MEKSRKQINMSTKGAHRGLALLLLIAMLTSLVPVAMAAPETDYIAQGFSKVNDHTGISDSTPGMYIKTTSPIVVISNANGTSFNVGANEWIQLLDKKYYFYDVTNKYYTHVYFKNESCWTEMDLIYDCVQSEASLLSYIKGTIWTQGSYTTLKEADVLKRDIRVHALQLALKQLGYLSGTVDGSYGPNTTAAVKAYQASAGLTQDGEAGNATLKSLYSAALNGAASGGGTASASISPSSPKVYVRLGSSTNIFKTETSSTGTSVPAGTVLQLVANKYYTGTDGNRYMCLYYNNSVHNVRESDIVGSIMSTAQFTSYVTGTLWTAQSFSSLNDDKPAPTGDVRTHGLQYALQLLGYYSGAMDGNFGSGTKSAVKEFQRANKLTVDGRAGPATQSALYPKAIASYNSGNVGNILYASTGGSTGGSTGTSSTGTLTTTASVNHRKSASTSAARLGVVPKNTTLGYTDTKVSGGVTWYKVVYSGRTGWLMGTFVNANGTGGGSTGGTVGTGSALGTVTITMPNTRVRKTANGAKTGTVLAKDSQVSCYSQTSAGGYTWYYIVTPSGVYGYVRGDCATLSSTGGGGGTSSVLPSSTKTYIKTSAAVNVFTTEEKPSSGFTAIPTGAVIQMVSPTTYSKGSPAVEYCSIYYNNKQYNAVYSDVKNDIMTSDQLGTYVIDTLWKASYSASLKESMGLKGDVRVHAAQLALTVLGYYTGAVDGNFGSGTTSAVKNFQRKNNLSSDGSIGPLTWVKLFPMASNAYASGAYIPGGGTGTPTANFGNVISVTKESWSNINKQASPLFPKSSAAAVMDVITGQVFTIYRWSGGEHADCVPYSAADTKIMCDIVNFPYNSSHPTSDQFTKIKNDSKNNNATYAWPDFKNSFGSGVSVGNGWWRRPALVNVNGYVYCASIYGWPHGANEDAFAKATRNGTLLYLLNNYYGMMCVHFKDSKGHNTASVDTDHQNAINVAYNYAKTMWPSLCK